VAEFWHPTGGHGSHAIALESDEHRRQKDYWCRAAEDAGYRVSTEFHTGGGTILDVAIDGPRQTGVEIQPAATSNCHSAGAHNVQRTQVHGKHVRHLPGDRQTSLRRMASPTRTVGRSDS
jgi:hypothetical protein